MTRHLLLRAAPSCSHALSPGLLATIKATCTTSGAGSRGGVKTKWAHVGEWQRRGRCCEGMKAMAAAQGKYAPVMRAILKSAWGAIPLSRSAGLLLLPCFCHLSSRPHSCLTCLFFSPSPQRLPPALQFVHFQPHCYSGAFQQLSDIRNQAGDQSRPRVQGGALQGQLVKSFHF